MKIHTNSQQINRNTFLAALLIIPIILYFLMYKNSFDQTFLHTYMPGILFLICISQLVEYFIVKDREKREERLEWNTLGHPAELKDAQKKLYGRPGDTFVVQSFVPVREHSEPKYVSEMRVGVGLLAHPDYPYSPLFFRIIFKWGPLHPADGKTLYRIEESGGGIYYLKKVE